MDNDDDGHDIARLPHLASSFPPHALAASHRWLMLRPLVLELQARPGKAPGLGFPGLRKSSELSIWPQPSPATREGEARQEHTLEYAEGALSSSPRTGNTECELAGGCDILSLDY